MNLARYGLVKDESGAMVAADPEPKLESLEDLVQELDFEPETRPRKSFWSTLWEEAFEELLEVLGLRPHSASLLLALAKSKKKRPPVTDLIVELEGQRSITKIKKNTTKRFIRRIKKKLGLLDLSKSIRLMSKEELLEHFPYRVEGEVNKTLFARNVVWQLYQEIQAGDPPEFTKKGCNARSIYYYVKNVIHDNSKLFPHADGISGYFSRAVKLMVLEGLIAYKDLNIIDDRRNYRRLAPAKANGHIILLAEKDAFFSRFVELGARYGVTVQITRGQGTVLMADTLLTEMFEAGYDMSIPLHVLSFCDFDPVGTAVPTHFANHLKKLGFTNVQTFKEYHKERPCLDIVNPHYLPSAVLKEARHKLKNTIRDNPSTATWATETGGVYKRGGKTYAISSEQLLPFVEENLEQIIQPFLRRPPEKLNRLTNYSYLRSSIREYIGSRVELGLLEPQAR